MAQSPIKLDNILWKEPINEQSHYGFIPAQRPLRKYINCGLIILDKPVGPTSHDIASQVKKILLPLGIKQVGHGGTLDPNASGILPLSLDHANLLQDVILAGTKEYIGTMHLHEIIPENQVREVMSLFQGKIYQRPPDRSAVKRELRIRVIDAIEVLQMLGKDVEFRVACEAGTYVRKIAVDVGEVLGCGAHLTHIRRTRSSSFSVSTGIFTPMEIEEAIHKWQETQDEAILRKIIVPMERVFDGYPRVIVKDTAIPFICQRAPVKVNDLVGVSSSLKNGDLVGIFTQKGEIIAKGVALLPASAMLTAKGGYLVKNLKVYLNQD